MTRDEKITTLPLQVEPFSEDFTGELAWGVLGNLLLRTSEIHADSHRFGFKEMKSANKAWVLSRLVIEMKKRPKTYEHYSISTWVNGVFRQFTNRYFAIHDDKGDIMGYARSIWALIDLNTRTATNLEQLPNGGFSECYLEEEIPIKSPQNCRLRDVEKSATYQAAFSDLDINGHVNSIRYIQLLLNLFPKEKYEQQTLSRIDISYAVESYCGDELHLFVQEKETGVYWTEIKKDRGESVVKAILTFHDK